MNYENDGQIKETSFSSDKQTLEQSLVKVKLELTALDDELKRTKQKYPALLNHKQVASLYTKKYYLLERIKEINQKMFDNLDEKSTNDKARWGRFELSLLEQELFALQYSDHPDKNQLFHTLRIREMNIEQSLSIIQSELFLKAVPCLSKDLPALKNRDEINILITEAKIDEQKIKKYRFHPDGREVYRLVVKRLHVLQKAKDAISHGQSDGNDFMQKLFSPFSLCIYTISYGLIKGIAALLIALMFGITAISFGRFINNEILDISVLFCLACSSFGVFLGLRSFLANGTTGVEILVFDRTPIIIPPSNPGRGLDNLPLIRWIVGIAITISFYLLLFFLLGAARDFFSHVMMLLLFIGGIISCALGWYVAKKTVLYID